MTNIPTGKLKQTSIITFIGKGVKRKEETQITPQWTKKLNTRVTFKPMSKRAKNANIKMVKELITDIIETIFPKQVSPMFAHLVSYKNLGKVSKKPIELRKVLKQTKRLKKKKKLGFACGMCDQGVIFSLVSCG